MPEDGPTPKIYHNDKVYKFDRYGLLCDGSAISVDSYCLLLANQPSTRVLLFQDMDSLGTIQQENVNWEVPFNELTTTGKLTKEHHKALVNFQSFHVTDVFSYHKGNALDEKYD